jgi:hypothetical protein
MRKITTLFLIAVSAVFLAGNLYGQSGEVKQEFGISAGALTNFPADQHYLSRNTTVFYLSPYIQVGRHEFSAGLNYTLPVYGLSFTDSKINPCAGVVAGYKFYIFDVYGRENLFIHYAFQYLRFKGKYDTYFSGSTQAFRITETDTYINNLVGLGYNLYLDTEERFGFFYTLDYVISQNSYKLENPGFTSHSWTSQYIWNNLSTNLGFCFKITPLKKKNPKENGK